MWSSNFKYITALNEKIQMLYTEATTLSQGLEKDVKSMVKANVFNKYKNEQIIIGKRVFNLKIVEISCHKYEPESSVSITLVFIEQDVSKNKRKQQLLKEYYDSLLDYQSGYFYTSSSKNAPYRMYCYNVILKNAWKGDFSLNIEKNPE